MGKWCLHASTFTFDQIVIKVAGNQDRHKSSDEFDFGPLVSMAHLYVFWNEIWPWHIGQVSDRCPLGYLLWFARHRRTICKKKATSLLPIWELSQQDQFSVISRCRSQHVSVESSSLFHHSIYLWFICFPWWAIDELGNLHADRTTVCFEPWQKPRARLGIRKTGLSPQYFNTDRSKAVLLLWFLTVTCSCCPYLCFGSPIMLVTYFVNFR